MQGRENLSAQLFYETGIKLCVMNYSTMLSSARPRDNRFCPISPFFHPFSSVCHQILTLREEKGALSVILCAHGIKVFPGRGIFVCSSSIGQGRLPASSSSFENANKTHPIRKKLCCCCCYLVSQCSCNEKHHL